VKRSRRQQAIGRLAPARHQLPDQTGWDVLRELKRQRTEVPTIVLSAVRVSQSRLEEFHPLAYLPQAVSN
jgi:DNA-binding response OmpR family regulator